MLDPVIEAFFRERKESWLKKKISTSMDEFEIEEKKLECDNKFSLEVWLPEAAKRIASRAKTTHPSKYSHPTTGIGKRNKENFTYVTPTICKSEKSNDGFLKSGNADVEIDSVGDAASLDVEAFLDLIINDKTILEHIEVETEVAKLLLTIQAESYEVLREGFLSIKESNEITSTSSRLKQVYFPLDAGYHQLSILTNSGLVFELKKRIDRIRFSDDSKESREKKRNNFYHKNGFSELYNLTTIGYGGAQPQNISVLNARNNGKAYLLHSTPQIIEKRMIRFPKHNFFNESLRYFEYREIFGALHKLFLTDYNNIHIRESRDFRLQDLIDRIIGKMWAVRAISKEQYFAENSQLKLHQKIWLCDEYQQTREEENDWVDTLCKEIARWTIITYQKLLGQQAVMLGEPERLHILKIVENNREALR